MRRQWWWWSACLVAAGCTIVSLSDEITQSDCRTDEDCEILNLRDEEDFDPCNVWQCAASRRCEQSTPDIDRDGAFPPLCVETGQPADCNDFDAARRPGHAELCDGKDNDCDLGVDEGMLAIEHTEVMAWREPVRELAYAWNAVSAELGIAYRVGDDQAAGFAVARPGRTTSFGMLRAAGSNDPLRGSGLSTGTRVGRFILGLTEADSPHRTWVGYVTGVLEGFTLNLDDDRIREVGLLCAEAENCEALAERPAATPATLSTLETQVLVSRARQSDPAARSCEAPRSEPVLLNLLVDNFAQLQERTSNAAELDRTNAAQAPALLAIDASEVRSATEQFGWLAAYLDPEGDLIVRRIRPDPAALLGSSLRLRIPREDEPYSHVQLGLGGISDNRMEIAIALQRGCGDGARILFGVLQLTWDGTGRTELRMYRDLELLAGEDVQAEQPVIAWNRIEVSWGVAYLAADGVYARVLDATGVQRGSTAYRVRDTIPSLREVAIVPSLDAEIGLFGVYSYVDATDSSSDPKLDAGFLRACPAP